MDSILSQPPRKSDDDLTAKKVTPPGRELAQLLADEARSRPSWPAVEGLQIPRLEQVPTPLRNSERWALFVPAELCRYMRDPLALVKRPRVAVLLATGAPWDGLSVHDEGVLRKLGAAALRDLVDLDHAEIATRVGLAGTAERRVQEMAREGRAMWVGLAGWPWWAIAAAYMDDDEPLARGLKGGLPDEWWTLERVEQTLAAWLRAGG